MTPLKRLFLDEDVSVLVAELLRSRGYTVATVTGLDLKGGTDAEQLAFARRGNFILVTHNRVDFEALAVRYFDEGRHHSGIIIAAVNPPQVIAERIDAVLTRFASDNFTDQLVYV